MIQVSDRATNSRAPLQAIAIFKIVKAVVFVAAGCAALGLLSPSASAMVVDWADTLTESPHNSLVQMLIDRVVDWISVATPNRLRLLALVAFAYAGLFIAEGVGLWLKRRWAEYLTVVATSSLIPFEIYEIVRGVHPLKILLLLGNILIVVYLVIVIRKNRGPHGGVAAHA